MRCRWVTDKEIGRYFLPECWGGAIYGPHACYCRRAPARDLEARITQLEHQVAALQEKMP